MSEGLSQKNDTKIIPSHESEAQTQLQLIVLLTELTFLWGDGIEAAARRKKAEAL